MAMLKLKHPEKILIQDLRIAETLYARTKGLIGTKELSKNQALWIHRCNSIHTFFMSYPIDCIFLDKQMKIVSLLQKVKPGRIVWPQWGASSVVELASGVLKNFELKLGDELYVGN